MCKHCGMPVQMSRSLTDRLLSGWFVTVLFIWCVLTLIRLYKPIQATRLAVFYATISFTLVSLLGSFIL